MIRSFYWHDYETFGVDPVHDRPSQFAGVRTDADLNIIEEPLVIYCKPTDDYLPSPEACLITGITPQKAMEEGLPETKFIAQINDAFSQPGTCVVGYNNLRFDDEVTRHTLYRNLRDPYAREWQNGNSRWDIIDMVRLTYALRPEGINWPRKEDGSPSFKLEALTTANGIAHEAAHDAMSDVEATLAVAKLIREKQPKLFDFVLKNKDKHSARTMLDTAAMKPVFHISAKYPATRGCCAMVAPLVDHPTNKNLVIVYDLREDPSELINATPEQIRERVFTSQAQLGDTKRFPLKSVQLNKCPVLAPANMLTTLSAERLAELELNGETLRANLALLRKAPGLPGRIAEAFDKPHEGNLTDPDEQLYAGGFISPADRSELNRVLQTPPEALVEETFNFKDERLQELLFRYRARNYPDSLTSEEAERWEEFRSQRLMAPKKGWLSLEAFGLELQRLASDPELSSQKQQILEDLHLYGESLIPYM
ncbi:MAG: exodeoxyribonuclease I [Marinobacter sp.]|uniref:exodeoxyribonuclease I n=1 Tax=Marinobacter sp. TaxID=50741 RepID=UPI001B545555|nr:exodeoxyribonuclease I [Marinobacter sp.]MBQ0745646.1 exodeoxyribonuclease I [Marinobacter sp.]MBQ0815580.1 exodeoxyribonuclease I [Marinobacter sp.]